MKQFSLRELSGNELFDLQRLCDSAPFTQASFYGNWQKNLGRVARRFLISGGDTVVAYFQTITYPLALGKNYLYIPYGPVTTDTSHDFFATLKEELKRIGKQENAVFIRLDFTPLVQNEVLSQFFTPAAHATYHGAYFQPRVEWFLDVKKSEDDLLSAMHEKTRYAIRLAERKGIAAEVVAEHFEDYFDVFYSLMAQTAKRNGFTLHPKEYYRHIFHTPPPHSYLSLARFGEKILAIDFIVIFSGVAHYVFGASSDEEKNRMPTYAAQWKAIRHAMQRGCAAFNFGGIATDRMPVRGWEGLTRFKKHFGGREVIHSNFFDVVINHLWYWLYVIRKRIKSIP